MSDDVKPQSHHALFRKLKILEVAAMVSNTVTTVQAAFKDTFSGSSLGTEQEKLQTISFPIIVNRTAVCHDVTRLKL